MYRLLPALVSCFALAACGDPGAPDLHGRTPPFPTPTPAVLGAVAGRVNIEIESEFTTEGDHGTFTISGVINDSGELVSRAISDGKILTMERELRGALGTIFVHMEGTARDSSGDTSFAWRITGGTRNYKGLTGEGTGTDSFTGPTSIRGQFTGTVEK